MSGTWQNGRHVPYCSKLSCNGYRPYLHLTCSGKCTLRPGRHDWARVCEWACIRTPDEFSAIISAQRMPESSLSISASPETLPTDFSPYHCHKLWNSPTSRHSSPCSQAFKPDCLLMFYNLNSVLTLWWNRAKLLQTRIACRLFVITLWGDSPRQAIRSLYSLRMFPALISPLISPWFIFITTHTIYHH